jgi:hypothetical protein
MSENVRFSLKPKQLQAIEMLVDMPRAIRPFKQVASDLRIDERTLRRWRNCPQFQAKLQERMTEVFAGQGVEVMKTVITQAAKGNVQMIRFYFEHVEGWRPPKARKQNSQIVTKPTTVNIVYP